MGSYAARKCATPDKKSFPGDLGNKNDTKIIFKWTSWSSLDSCVVEPNIPAPVFSLSQTTGYAVKALTCIAAGCEVKQIRDIADCTSIPIPYLAKVIHRLGKAGILESKRGNKGGVWLARNPGEISLYEISVAVDGDDQFSSCLLGLESCSDDRACPTHVFWKAARAQIRHELETTSLADVVAFEKRRAGKGSRGLLTRKLKPSKTPNV